MSALALLLLIESGLQAQVQWLVLNNDQSIEGSISLEGERYTVVAENGSRIVIPKSRVSFVADSINDIYWDRWSRVDPADAKSHMNLFRWCLKHDLLDEAQNQIDLVARLENVEDQTDHLSRMAQELELVVQRIEKEAKLARQKEIASLNIRHLPTLPGAPTADFAAVPTIPHAPIDAEGRPVRRLAPAKPPIAESGIALVDFEEDVSANATSTRRDKPAWVSNRQLDRETRAMPNGSVSFYKRHIETKLIANCIQCHDSRSISMPLSKRAFGQTIPRRMSQQNLHFVVEQVDRSAPLESTLLKMATTAHGNQKAAPFEPYDPFIFELKKWSVAVSDNPAAWLAKLSEESENKSLPTATETSSIANGGPIEDVESTDIDPYDPSAFNDK